MITAVRPAPGSAPRNGLPEPRGYVYRGSGEDTLTAFMDRGRGRPPRLRPGPPARAPHGTMSAVRRHHRHKEPLCEACRQARNRDQNERRGGAAA